MSYADLEIGGSGDYIKLVAGNPVTLNILTRKPNKEIIHWENKKKTACLGDKCDMCAEGNKPKQRWVVDVYDRKDSKVKKFEFGASIASQLKSIAEMMAETGKTIHGTDVRIKTEGSGLETAYSVLPVPMGSPIPQDIADKFDVPF